MLNEIRFQGGDIEGPAPEIGDPLELLNPFESKITLDGQLAAAAPDEIGVMVQIYATREIVELTCVETGNNTLVFKDAQNDVAVQLSSSPSLSEAQLDGFYAIVTLDKEYTRTLVDQFDESDFIESTNTSKIFLESEPGIAFQSSARPTGILASLSSPTGVVASGPVDSRGFMPVLSELPDKVKSRIRYEDLTKTDQTISVTITAKNSMGTAPESRQLVMNKIGNGVYESEKKLVAYNGKLEETVRQNLENHFGVMLVHNPEIAAVIANVVTANGTYEVFVNVDAEKPNILVADGQSTTEVVFRDTAKKAGIKVTFSVDNGTIEGDVKVTDAMGVAKVTYTADNKTSMAMVKAKVVGEDLTLNTLVYNESYNFLNLSANAGMAGYNDDTFVQNAALGWSSTTLGAS